MSPGRLEWWTWYVAGLVLIATLQPILINFAPSYALETGFDWFVAGLCVLLLPATLVAIAYGIRGTKPTGLKLIAGIAGVVATIALVIVGQETSNRALATNTCKFGRLTYGEVWIKVDPPPGTPETTYKVHIDWGPVMFDGKIKLKDARYLRLEKKNAFRNDQLGVSVSPEAYLTCGSAAIPAGADATALRGWKPR